MGKQVKKTPEDYWNLSGKTVQDVQMQMMKDGVSCHQQTIVAWQKNGIPASFHSAFSWARAVGYNPLSDCIFECPRRNISNGVDE